jgi:hypothetical protein
METTTTEIVPGSNGFPSLTYGGTGGGEFDDGLHTRVCRITVRAGKIVDGISIQYYNGIECSHGGTGGEEHKLFLPRGEFISQVTVRVGRFLHSISFMTNMNQVFGPFGRKEKARLGGIMFGDIGPSEEFVVTAPSGYMLRGVKGREGKFLDAIGFNWGPVTHQS